MHGTGPGEESLHLLIDPELDYIKRWIVAQVC